MKKSLLFAALAVLAIFTSCSDDDDNGSVVELDAVLGVVTYNSPQNLSVDRSNPDRLSLDSPGEFFEIDFVATDVDGLNMNFVSMSSISNDWLFAPRGTGIELFDASGSAILGDITDQVLLWDAGTEEENVETRGGGSPELREDDDNPNVRIQDVDVSDYITVELTEYDAATSTFTMVITNLRGEFADEDPIRVSPGVVVLQGQNGPFFTDGEADRGEGLQLLAERGDFSELEMSLNSQL